MEDWQRQVEAVLRNIPGYNPWDQAGDAYLDHAAAVEAINWFPEHLKHVEGSARGEPFELKPWQAAVVGNIFGWRRVDDAGRVVRRYRKAFLLIARGNGKTPLAAGIVLRAFYEDGEPGAQCYLAAGQREQAGYLFRNAAGFIDQDPDLSARSTLYRGDQHRSIVLKEDPLSFCKVVPGDGSGRHGGIPHITVIDELHVQESRDLLDAFETGMAKKTRAQPLLVEITTADVDRPSICNEEHDYARAVRDNGGDRAKAGFDPSFLPVIYELKPDADISDESLWPMANPNLDVSVSRESLRKAVQKAKEVPAAANEIKRLHFNIRTGQAVQLIPLDQWDACKQDIRLEDYAERPCYGGLDLSSNEDLTSFALVFPEEDESVAVFCWTWCPQSKLRQRIAMKRAPWDVWAQGGHVITAGESNVDTVAVREHIVATDARFQIQMIYVDPAAGGREAAVRLQEEGGFDGRVTLLPQTMANLSSPTKDLIFRTKHGRIKHDGNPVLRWAVGNLSGHYKGRIPPGKSLADCLDMLPIMPSKQSSAEKIDPVAAIVNALLAKASVPQAAPTFDFRII